MPLLEPPLKADNAGSNAEEMFMLLELEIGPLELIFDNPSAFVFKFLGEANLEF